MYSSSQGNMSMSINPGFSLYLICTHLHHVPQFLTRLLCNKLYVAYYLVYSSLVGHVTWIYLQRHVWCCLSSYSHGVPLNFSIENGLTNTTGWEENANMMRKKTFAHSVLLGRIKIRNVRTLFVILKRESKTWAHLKPAFTLHTWIFVLYYVRYVLVTYVQQNSSIVPL